MRPPICAICDREFFDDSGSLVCFQRTETDKAWDKKAEEPGFVGHPPYCEWFCGEHVAKAKELSYLTRPEAMKTLREFFQESN